MTNTEKANREPPINREAEEAVVGSMLIDPDAVIRVQSVLTPKDFYTERLGMIYQALITLHDRCEPPDLVTVISQLTNDGVLEQIGGPAAIAHLINAAPTSVHAEYYAELVRQASLLRQIISTASTMVIWAYASDADADATLDRCQQAMLSVGGENLKREAKSMQVIMSNVVERLDYLHRNPGGSMGVPTGFHDLDKLLGGLQKSDLLILASRPGVGKTSLAGSIAINAARKSGKRVGYFSLEMSSEQLAQRFLAAETGIPQHRLRQGDVLENEWYLLMEAMGVLSDLSIIIDDSPALSIMELNTRSRRMQAEGGLDLVVVDYLQLMRSERRSENRVQEISQITLGLKQLARELDVPVLALSQLSRAVELRADHKPILSDLRESGCVPAGTHVLRADNNAEITIGDLVLSQECPLVWSVDSHQRLVPQQLVRAFPTGIKPVFRVRVASGQSVEATANHPFLTCDGWVRLDALNVGDFIATPRRLPAPVSASECIPEALEVLCQIRENPNNDLVPWPVVEKVRAALVQAGMSHRDLADSLGERYCGSYLLGSVDRPRRFSRGRLRRMGEVTGSDELVDIATSDLYWAEVLEITPQGEQPTFDVTVEGEHNFIADGIVVHNSIEADADVVMFIYREDLVKENSERKNVADIIVAKHRNGPLDTVSLYFNRELTSFSDLTFKREPIF